MPTLRTLIRPGELEVTGSIFISRRGRKGSILTPMEALLLFIRETLLIFYKTTVSNGPTTKKDYKEWTRVCVDSIVFIT